MKRKLFVAALVLILALAMLPSFALADGPVATVNGVSYNSVGEALTAALSAGSNGGTANIQLLADIEGTADAGIQIPAGVTVVIDLNGHALVGKTLRALLSTTAISPSMTVLPLRVIMALEQVAFIPPIRMIRAVMLW